MDLRPRGAANCGISILSTEPLARQQAQRPLSATIVAELTTSFEKHPCCSVNLALPFVASESHLDQITRNPAFPQRSLDTRVTPTGEAALVLHVAESEAPVINRKVLDQVGHHPLNLFGSNFTLRQPMPHLRFRALLAPDRAQRSGKYFIRQSSTLGGLLRG